MINIIERGGIHKTKHEFGPFNRKYTPKRNKKRALIVQRGVYSEHSFAGLNSPSRGRHVKNTARHPFLARLGLQRAAWRLKRLGRLIGVQVTEMSERKGFVRRFLEVQPDPWVELGRQFADQVVESGNRDSVARGMADANKRYTAPRPVTPGPVPHFVVEFVDEKFCFLDVVEPEMILELYTDIVSRMPEGMIPEVGDYQSFDPSDKDGTTGSRVRMSKGKIVEVQRLPTKWEGPYKNWDKPEPPKPGQFSGFNRYRTVKISSDTVLKPGEAVVCLPDGTFEPFMGRGATPHYGGPYPEDYVDTLSIAFGVPKDFFDNESERPSMGFIPKGKLTLGDIRGIGEPRYDPVDWQLPPATPAPGRTIEHLAPGFDLITDTISRPIEGELLPVSMGWRIVKASELLNIRLPFETVNETDTSKEVKMTDKKRDILHIVVEGDADWTPTQEDMKLVSELFQDAVDSDKPGIIVTRSGITASVLSVSEGVEVKITKAQVTKDDMAKRIDSTAPEDCIAKHPVHPSPDDIDEAIAESQAALDSKDKQ